MSQPKPTSLRVVTRLRGAARLATGKEYTQMTTEQLTVGDDHETAEAEASEQRQDHGAAEEQDEQAARLVPVTESIRYRRRAQAAEQKCGELQQQFEDAQRQLEQTRQELAGVERRQRVDQLLVESDAIDLEAARLLNEAAAAQMDEPDVTAAVEELRRRKPYLFARPAAEHAGGMSPRPRQTIDEPLSDAAEHAAASGDRRDLLRYLRMRRKRS